MIFFSFKIRRKKKCVAYKGTDGDEGNDLDNHVSDDNLGSCGSVDEAQTPEEDTESLNQSLSSPGCLSGLSSLQSPSTSLASPLNLLASPSTPHEQQQQQQQLGISYLETQSNSLVSTNSTGAGANLNPSKKKGHNNNNQKSAGRNSPLRSLHEIKTEFDLTARSSSSSSSSSSSLGGGNLHYQQQQQQHMHHQQQQHHHHLIHLQQQQQQLQQQQLQQQHDLHYEKANVVRNPVGANPRDVNNPLSVNQLTKRDYVNHNSPINHHSHSHLIGASSPVSPGTSTMSLPSPTPSSSSTLTVAAAAALHLHQQLQQHTQNQQSHHHHHHLHQQQLSAAQQFNLNHHLHGTHHFGVGVTNTQTNVVGGVQQSAAGRHRGGDDGGAISVT